MNASQHNQQVIDSMSSASAKKLLTDIVNGCIEKGFNPARCQSTDEVMDAVLNTMAEAGLKCGALDEE